MSCVGAVFRRSDMSGRVFMPSLRLPVSMSASQDLIDGVDRALRPAIAGGDGEQAIQERIPGIAGLEPGSGPEVIGRRIDLLAPPERGDHLRRTMTEPE